VLEARSAERYQSAQVEITENVDEKEMSESDNDTIDDILGSSSSEEDEQQLILKFRANTRRNLSLVINSK